MFTVAGGVALTVAGLTLLATAHRAWQAALLPATPPALGTSLVVAPVISQGA